MDIKSPSRANSSLYYTIRLIPCFHCAHHDSQSWYQGDIYDPECSNCNGEGFTTALIPLTRSLLESILYEESEKLVPLKGSL